MSEPGSPRSPRRAAALLALTSTLVTLGLLEGASRVYLHVRPERAGAADWDTDSLAPPPAPPGAFRIFLYGGSTVAGTPLVEYSFARQLEFWLHRLAPQRAFQVVNYGAPGKPTEFAKLELERTIDARPDLVIVHSLHNEFLGWRPPSASKRVRREIRRWLDATATARVLRRVFGEVRQRGVAPPPISCCPRDRTRGPRERALPRARRRIRARRRRHRGPGARARRAADLRDRLRKPRRLAAGVAVRARRTLRARRDRRARADRARRARRGGLPRSKRSSRSTRATRWSPGSPAASRWRAATGRARARRSMRRATPIRALARALALQRTPARDRAPRRRAARRRRRGVPARGGPRSGRVRVGRGQLPPDAARQRAARARAVAAMAQRSSGSTRSTDCRRWPSRRTCSCARRSARGPTPSSRI